MRHARANQGFRVWEPLTMRYGSSTFTHTETAKSYCSFSSVYFSPSPLPTPLPQPQQTHRRPNEGSVGIQLERGKGVGFSSTETKTYKTKTNLRASQGTAYATNRRRGWLPLSQGEKLIYEETLIVSYSQGTSSYRRCHHGYPLTI